MNTKKPQRLFALLLTVIMVLGSLPPITANGNEFIQTASDIKAYSDANNNSLSEQEVNLSSEDLNSNPVIISSAEELAALGGQRLTGDYQIAGDIDMSGITMKPITEFRDGTFDGGGFTISNLSVTSSGDTGLFANIGRDAEITGITLKNCTIENTGGSYVGAGALAGKISSSGSVISNCGVIDGVISSTSSSAVYLGGITGYASSAITIQNSFSDVKITPGSYSSCRVGGILGSASANTIVENCYARGTIDSNTTYTGGLIGYVYGSSYSGLVTVSDCYSAVSTTGYTFAYVSTGGNFTNCYYDETLAESSKKNTQDGITGITTEDLKNSADKLGEAFQPDLIENINEGYPILKWQDPNATYTVTLKVTPADAKVTWNHTVQPTATDGVYQFSNLSSGTTIDYQVEQASDQTDYASQKGTITVGKSDITRNINLVANLYDLTFQLTPTDATLTVTNEEESVLEPTDGLTYSVPRGTYHYSAEAFGYQKTEGTVEIFANNQMVSVDLKASPIWTITFAYNPIGQANEIRNGNLTVQTGDTVIQPQESSSGLIYRLPTGYDYSWEFRSANYARQSGEIKLSDKTETGNQQIEIPLTEKTSWEGATDIIEPTAVNGVYQISSGSELAWLAQEVNAGRKSDCSAVLTANIDLGNEEWTPIGRSGYGYSWAGTFDGQGYTISGLSVNSDTYDQGLFGYVNGGTIENLIVEGEVTGGGSSNSGGVGGIVGTLNSSYSSESTIQNCVNRADVSGGNNVGGIVGLITGSYNKTIEYCANYGKISGNNSIGGLIGNFYYKGQLKDSYNRGSVNAEVSKAGGIIGYMSDNNASALNCYTTGDVSTGTDSAPVIGMKSSGTVTNLYYLDTLGSDSNAIAKTENEMKGAGFPGLLGEAFAQDMSAPINDGYPIFAFQDTTPTYEATFTVSPVEAEFTLYDATESIITGEKTEHDQSAAIWRFMLRNGEYSYHVSAFGKVEQSGTITVDNQAIKKTITLNDAPSKNITFQIEFEDNNPDKVIPAVTVTYNGDGREIQPSTDYTYTLPYGDYHYVVKANGYGKAQADFSVSESSDTNIMLSLSPSAAWDGESIDEITPNPEGIYEISTGAELAWISEQVNEGTKTDFNIILTDDIDLGENPWTPIGTGITSATRFQGSFDGQGYTISGLNVFDANYAGLFGYISGTSSETPAIIKNLIVQGSVNGTNNSGGIAGRADNTVFSNCGNEASVSGAEVGGIVGRQHSYGSPIIITNCYNSGAITASSRAGGILGYVNDEAQINNCYNTGTVTGDNYAGGLRGMGGTFAGEITNSYNAGNVSGDTAGALVAGAATIENCYYLTGSGNDTNGAQEVSSAELKTLADTLNNSTDPVIWKNISDFNNGYPVFVWQKTESGNVDIPLNKVTNLVWQKDENTGLSTGTATWDAVENATSYTVILWEYWAEENEETGITKNGMSAVQTVTGVTDTYYDFTEAIKENGASWYYFTVTPIASADSGYISGELPIWDDDTQEGNLYDYLDFANDEACYRYYEKLSQPTGLSWNDSFARWNFVDEAAGYLVVVYRLDNDNALHYTASGITDAAINQLDCRNHFAVGSRYVFTVTALSEEYLLTGTDEKNSMESLTSNDDRNGGTNRGIYTATASEPDPGEEVDRADWIPISTAEEWVALANIEDIPADDSDNTSQQSIAWGKKYYLTADLDFSNLSTIDQAKTKSIGNITNRFTGILDGNGHKITNLTLSNYDAGLFSYIGATGQVYDLTIEGANVLFSDNAAVLALNNYGTIYDCGVVNCNITADTGAVLGGMVSRNYGIVRESYVQNGTLTSNSTTATGHAGFVGANESGGLIERCWSSMDVSTNSEYAGGFVGLSYGGTIRDCFALGNVSARSYSGGFAGRSVFDGNRYENCYAAGVLTVTDGSGHGFIGGSKPDSAFQPDLSQEVLNCFYNNESPSDIYATGKSLSEMTDISFLTELGGTEGIWTQSPNKNSGLPYLTSVAAPEADFAKEITVTIALATYDKNSYTFTQYGDPISVTIESNGNTRVTDLMDAAVKQNKLTYSYETTASYGRYIHTINGYSVEQPDGWMFTINDNLSNLSASLATIQDGDRLLWFEGTTENHYQGPTWDSLTGSEISWVDIQTAEELLDLAQSNDPETMAKNYRLTANINLNGINFNGIGTSASPFTGTFDGQGHTVFNLSMEGSDNVGFFGVIKGAVIKNLKLENARIEGTGKNIGTLVGWAQVELDQENAADNVANLIGNCAVSGTVTGINNVGGLVGLNDGKEDSEALFSIASSIDKCTADVIVTGVENGGNIGGLVGENNGIITKSASIGNVHAENTYDVGGFAGNSYGDIYDSHAEGDVVGKSTVGGFVGSSNGILKNCYSLGNVSGQSYTGGFAGSIAMAENIISAGQVTVIGNSTTGYNGGLAGNMSGWITGPENQIAVKNAYANCTQADGSLIAIIGNTLDYPSEEQQKVLADMTLKTDKETADKLYEMFGVSTTVPDSNNNGGGNSKYTVTFDTQGGSTIDSIRINKNTPLTKPQDPTREGYTFAGWFTNKECTQAYDFSSKVTNSITLYAKWEKISTSELPFEDVKESDWFYEDVQYAYTNNLFTGISDSKFAPNTQMTRAMLVTVLYRSEGEPNLSNELPGYPFTDVDEKGWYATAVQWAWTNEIIQGHSEKEFAPDDFITREQIVAILQRYANYKEIATDETNDLLQFTDATQVSDWALDNMKWAVGAGLITGDTQGKLNPQGNATRAEVATILHRFLEK